MTNLGRVNDLSRAADLTGATDEAAGPGSDIGDRADLIAVGLAAALILIAALVGVLLKHSGIQLHATTAPLFARFHPHLGIGTPFAVVTAGLVVRFGPKVAADWRWHRALTAATAAGLVWLVSLALVGGREGILRPLATPYEYLIDVPRAGPLPDFLRSFAARIPAGSAAPWHTHAAGHPPGMLLVFLLLSRIGLGGAGPAAAVCLLAGALTVPLVASATRAACGEDWARRTLPFSVLMPAAIWAGVSADAVIAATGALGLALITHAAVAGAGISGRVGSGRVGPGGIWLALAGGVVLGVTCFLSYGAVLLAVPAAAVLIGFGRWQLIGPAAVGALAVVTLFAEAGFPWWEGYVAVHARYLAGYGGTRPYSYWSWANLAALAIAAGPAVVAGLARLLFRRSGGSGRSGGSSGWRSRTSPLPIGALALAGGAFAAILLATASGMSKAEVERIWLPWTIWLPVACALLPWSQARWWLIAQATVALLVEHLLITPW